MLLATYQQRLDPLLEHDIPWSSLWSTFFAALPVLVLFWLLVPRRWLAPKAGVGGVVAALLVAILIYDMPPLMAGMSFVHGAAFGLLPVGWTVFNAMLLYNITVETGQFAVVRRSVAGLSGDARIQAVLIGFCFGAFLEGAAGGGSPVAICGAVMVGLGFKPFLAAVLCLIANTSPVAYGGLGTPLIVLGGVTDLPTERLSVMAGHQLPFLSMLIPLYMVRCMCSWKKTFEVWPALLVAGGSFAAFQYSFATAHTHIPGLVLYPMTDIGGGIFSMILTAVFLKFWKPREEWHFHATDTASPLASPGAFPPKDAHGAEAAALLANETPVEANAPPLTIGSVCLAWAPFALMSIFLMLSGLIRERETKGPVPLGPIQTNYVIPLPWLDKQSYRESSLHPVHASKMEPVKHDDEVGQAVLAANVLSAASPVMAAVQMNGMDRFLEKPERATFNFAWLTAPGTPVFVAALVSMLLLRMNRQQIGRVIKRTVLQMKIPIPTIALMLGLSYVTRYGGLDATLGVAFALTGILYPFFAAILGWLGVFLTGTDAGSNALFGSLQKITATEVYTQHPSMFAGNLSLEQSQVLICTANSTGGVMGKMIDAQSICVATAATHQIGKEADIFKAVMWHSIILASVVGLMTLLQAYVWPFTLMVP